MGGSISSGVWLCAQTTMYELLVVNITDILMQARHRMQLPNSLPHFTISSEDYDPASATSPQFNVGSKFSTVPSKIYSPCLTMVTRAETLLICGKVYEEGVAQFSSLFITVIQLKDLPSLAQKIDRFASSKYKFLLFV
jgi:hypothetical protein